MKTLLCVVILCSIPVNYGRLPPGPSYATAWQNYNSWSSSTVSFILGLANYSNQQLKNPQYLDYYGRVHDRPQTIAPGVREYMTAKKASWTFRGVSGVVSWDIGNTNKMVVVMYAKPWSAALGSCTLAVGIFPKGDLTGFFNKMYSGEEQNFMRDYYGTDSPEGPIRYRDDPDFMIQGNMGDANQANINVSGQLPELKTNLSVLYFRLISIQSQYQALLTHLILGIKNWSTIY